MLTVNASSGASHIHRLGLFANEFIPKGQKVAEYREGFDLALSEDQVSALPCNVREQFVRHAFFHQGSGRFILDSDDGRFTNHSDDANTRQTGLMSYAVRDISPGEELTLDYRELGTDAPLHDANPSLLPAETNATLHGWIINGEAGLCLQPTRVGWGLFAARSFAVGEHVLTFTGPILTQAETLALGDWSMYPVQIDHDRYVHCGPPGAFVNHQCEASCGLRDSVRLVALRALNTGDEITMDYSCSMSGDPETMPCQCGGPKCRKMIGNFENLPESLRREYLHRGVVSDFIATQATPASRRCQ